MLCQVVGSSIQTTIYILTLLCSSLQPPGLFVSESVDADNLLDGLDRSDGLDLLDVFNWGDVNNVFLINLVL